MNGSEPLKWLFKQCRYKSKAPVNFTVNVRRSVHVKVQVTVVAQSLSAKPKPSFLLTQSSATLINKQYKFICGIKLICNVFA